MKNWIRRIEVYIHQDKDLSPHRSTGQPPDKMALVRFCRQEKTIREMMETFDFNHRETFTRNHLRPLLKEKLIAMTAPDKPNHPKQKYRTTALGMKRIQKELGAEP